MRLAGGSARSPCKDPGRAPSPREPLAERYARGEIDDEEYRRRLAVPEHAADHRRGEVAGAGGPAPPPVHRRGEGPRPARRAEPAPGTAHRAPRKGRDRS
ncbi:SHOCT domain-containing protein [Streptomyces sp. NPDC001070]